MMKTNAAIGLLLFAACATGHGEAAQATLEWSLVPEGAQNAGFTFAAARIQITEVESEASEPDEPGNGHGHAHLDAAPSALAQALAHETGDETSAIDLLAGETHLGEEMVPAGVIEGAHIHLAPISTGEGAGCLVFVRGETEDAALPIPVEICVPPSGASEVHVDFALSADKDSNHHLELIFAMDTLLQGISWAQLERSDRGIILVDGSNNESAAATIRHKLLESFHVRTQSGPHDH